MAIQPVEGKKVAEDIKAAAAAAVNGTSKAAEMSQDTGRKLVGETQVQARAMMEKGMEQANKAAQGMFKAYGEAVEFGRGNIEAATKSAQTLTTGLQELSRQYFAFAQGLSEQAVEGTKALAGVRSLKEAADIQSGLARSTLEKTMSETARLNEAAFRLMEQSAAPLTQRVTLAFEKLARPAAA